MIFRAVVLWLALLFLALWIAVAALQVTPKVCIAGQVIELGSTASTTPVVCE